MAPAPRALEPLLANTPVAKWLARAEAHRVQILVRVIDPEDPARITEHRFRVDSEYVYPASAIKPFIAVAALRRLQSLQLEPTARFGSTSVAEEIDKLLRASDNAAFGRLFDLVGHRDAHEILWAMGFSSLRIHHRMGGTREDGLLAPRIELVPESGPAAVLEPRHSDLLVPDTAARHLTVGREHVVAASRRRVSGPMSFEDKNYASLDDLQRLLLSLVLPEATGAVDLGLRAGERELLVAALSAAPAVSENAVDEHRPLLPGIRRVLPPPRLRYAGRSGRAYGFHVENAYVEDRDTHRAMFVTAAIYADDDGVVNDDLYDYDDVTQPFMGALGEALARAVFTSK